MEAGKSTGGGTWGGLFSMCKGLFLEVRGLFLEVGGSFLEVGGSCLEVGFLFLEDGFVEGVELIFEGWGVVVEVEVACFLRCRTQFCRWGLIFRWEGLVFRGGRVFTS